MKILPGSKVVATKELRMESLKGFAPALDYLWLGDVN